MAIPRVGERFRDFLILSKAGEGGMGVVFRAHDTRLGRDVALKFLTGVGSVDAAAAERLRAEARSLAALNHGNIVTLYDIDEDDGSPFLVLEWVSGTDLASSSPAGPCGEGDFFRIALPVAEALAAAHARNVVHRDLKPGNVLLSDDGGAKLVDFGLARFRDPGLTRTASIAGTPAYMSPEQVAGGEVGPPSDVFSFGVLAYEMLTGRLPFEGTGYPEAMFAIVHKPHVPLETRRPDLSPAVTAIVERCLSKRPEDRFADGSDLAQNVHRVIRARNAVDIEMLSKPRRDVIRRVPGGLEIRYCRTSDGVSIAHAAYGAGPVLVRVLGWFTHLVIYGAYSRGVSLRPGYDPEEIEALHTLMRKGWGRDTPEYRRIFTTAYFGPEADPGLVAHFDHLQRAAADGDTAARYQESLHRRGDGRGFFERVRTPTLVIHCRDDQVVPFERLIASVIPGAQLLSLPTGTHYFPVSDDVTHRMADAIRRFTGPGQARPSTGG